MRIARWRHDGAIGEGFVVGDAVIAFPDGLTVADVLARGTDAAQSLLGRIDAADGVALDEVELLPPVVPPAIRDFVAFEEHVEGVSASVDGKSEVVPEWYQAPTFYFTNPHTLRATGEMVPVPETEWLDFELEVAAVIGGVSGSDGRSLTVPDAAAHIFGYTIMNDWSARDLQSREMKVRLGPCKGKDFAMTLGPWIVTADEVADLVDDEGFLALRAEVSVNGGASARTSSRTWAGRSPSSSLTRRGTPASSRATCWARGPSATVGASASSGGAAVTCRRSSPATRCAWWSSGSARS